jgi:GMP synthase-like glutamine amidotransferase
MILFIQHIDIEGPDTLLDFLKKKGFKGQTVHLNQGHKLPKDFKGIDAVVSLGGPMNVDETGKYPYLADEIKFIKKVVVENIPFLGICLGSQLLAKACDVPVGKSPEQEIGFSKIKFSKAGEKDPLFKGLSQSVDVFQWHGDMFEIPSNGVLLASSKVCPHQAFKVGSRAYGLQFHIEVTAQTVESWIDEYFNKKDPQTGKKKKLMLDDYAKKQKTYAVVADQIFENFLNIMRSQEVKVS